MKIKSNCIAIIRIDYEDKIIYMSLMIKTLIAKLKNLLAYKVLMNNKYQLFIRYCIIGVTGVLIDVVIFYILNNKFNIYYQYANIISVSFGITNNFFLNAYLNFKKTDKIFIRFVKFYLIGFFGLLLSAFLLFLFVENLHLNIMHSKMIIIFAVAVTQFFLNKFISFR